MAQLQIPTTFRRWVSEAPGKSFRDAARLVTIPTTAPEPNQVLVKTKYATINGGHDTFVARRERMFASITGMHHLGADSLGQVMEVGSQITSLKVGDYVLSLGDGGYSEFTYPQESRCTRVEVPKMEYAAVRINGTLICGALEKICCVQGGDTLLVTAAAGGVGHLAVQLGKLHGCHVIGVCGGPQKKEVVTSLGADRVIDYREESLDEVLTKECPHGLDYVVENVGGEIMKIAFDHLTSNGKLLSIGYFSQYPHTSFADQEKDYVLEPGFPTLKEFLHGRENVVINGKELIKSIWVKDAEERADCQLRACQLIDEQKWKVLIDQYALSSFTGLENVPDSIDYMLSGKSIGKVLIEI